MRLGFNMQNQFARTNIIFAGATHEKICKRHLDGLVCRIRDGAVDRLSAVQAAGCPLNGATTEGFGAIATTRA